MVRWGRVSWDEFRKVELFSVMPRSLDFKNNGKSWWGLMGVITLSDLWFKEHWLLHRKEFRKGQEQGDLLGGVGVISATNFLRKSRCWELEPFFYLLLYFHCENSWTKGGQKLSKERIWAYKSIFWKGLEGICTKQKDEIWGEKNYIKWRKN